MYCLISKEMLDIEYSTDHLIVARKYVIAVGQ